MRVALGILAALGVLALSRKSRAAIYDTGPNSRPTNRPGSGITKSGGVYDSVHAKGVDAKLLEVAERVRVLGGNFALVDGHRTVEEQRAAKASGASTFSNPELGPHVQGLAIDIWASPDRDSWQAYLELARLFARASEELGARIRWGGAWETLTTSEDPSKQAAAYAKWKRAKGEKPFVDPGHFELKV